MTVTAPATPEHLAALRSAFDRSFAQPPRPTTTQVEDLLTVQVAGCPYAIRVAAISGLFADRSITPVPGPVTELLGVAGFRGSIIAVYDLGALLGHGSSPTPRWLVLDSGSPVLALAFDSIDGHLRVPVGSIALAAADDPTRDGARAAAHEVVQTPDGVRPVVGIVAVRAAIEARIRQHVDRRKR
jgi:purine-binding chemotaxis protein CheW